MVQYVDHRHYPRYANSQPSPIAHRPVLTENSIFQFGVQYPEILSAGSPADHQNAAVEAIQRLYSERPPTPPASPAPHHGIGKVAPPDMVDGPAKMPVELAPRYPAGCIPWSSWKETKGYPETLPRMYTPHLTFLKRK